MTSIPADAPRSEDGNFWWDGQQWQPVSKEGGGDTSGGDSGDRAAARVAQGLPASLNDLTDEHRQGHLGEPTVEVEAVDAEQGEVLAMQDTANGGGEATA